MCTYRVEGGGGLKLRNLSVLDDPQNEECAMVLTSVSFGMALTYFTVMRFL